MGIIGCSIYKEWKTVIYLNRLGTDIHKEVEEFDMVCKKFI
jgi:hypothetical protein